MFSVKLYKDIKAADFSDCPCLIDHTYQYRSLGEMIAIGRQTGIPPLPTRNGVYIGDKEIPRDPHDKANLQRDLMRKIIDAEEKLHNTEIEFAEQKSIEERKALEDSIRKSLSSESKSSKSE